MLPALIALAPPPPSGTTTLSELCRWLTERTGARYAPGGEFRDYPVFLSLHTGEPGRIRALVAAALGGRWEQDGSTIRLAPVKPKEGEGFAEFERAYRAAAPAKSALAGVPIKEVFALKAGRILRFGHPESAWVRPLPPELAAKARGSESGTGYVYLRRFANGVFETKVTLPTEKREIFSGDSQIEFRTLPPEVVTALGDEAKKVALDEAAKAELERLSRDPTTVRVDPKAMDRIDPLAGVMDPVLKPLGKAMKEDLVVALPDFSIMAMMGSEVGTVESVMKGFSQVIDWTVRDGAFVGCLPVSERLNRAQTRRTVLGNFILSARSSGVPSPAALQGYLSSQRPQASESWSDVMMLVMAGLVIDETHLGDHPFNLRLGAAMTPRDWDLLRSGRPITMGDLSLAARGALVELLAQSRERMSGGRSDPALWSGFPNVRAALTAKVEDEAVVIGRPTADMESVMTLDSVGYGYERLKARLGTEPLYKPARRRTLTLTITQVSSGQSVETGFGDVSVEPRAKAVPWRELPPTMVGAIEEAIKRGPPSSPAMMGGTP